MPLQPPVQSPTGITLYPYAFSISTDFPNGTVDAAAFHQEIFNSAITVALDGVSTDGDTCTVFFKAVLGTPDLDLLMVLVGEHQGEPAFTDTPLSPSGIPLVMTSWKEGTPTDLISCNWCDKTTWWVDSARVEEEVLVDSGDGLTFNSQNAFWIDTTHGKIAQEHRLIDTHNHQIWSNGSPLQESSPDTMDGDYQVDFVAGTVTFNSDQSGNVITATYNYAQSSVFYIEPYPAKKLRLTQVEVQFSSDIVLTDDVVFEFEGFVEVFAPQMVNDVDPDFITSFPTGTRIPLGRKRVYKTMMDYITEAQRAYPEIPVSGGPGWRGLHQPLQVYRWPYQEDATRDLYSSQGVRIKVYLRNDVPFEGASAIATFYAVSME